MMTKPTQTETMTPAELNRAIAELRGWTKITFGAGASYWQMGQNPVSTCYENLPEYLTDANAALELLEELPIADLHELICGAQVTASHDSRHRISAKSFRVAVCLRWIFKRTGKRVELIEG